MLTTNMLSFERSFQISEALLFAERADKSRSPIEVFDRGVLGQISEANAKKNEGKNNLQGVDTAQIPPGHEALVISFNMRVMPGSVSPASSDNDAVARNYASLASDYAASGGYHFLAARYVWNILNGRFAWRNRYQTDTATVTVRFGEKEIVADALALELHAVQGVEEMRSVILSGAEHLDDLIAGVSGGLSKAPFQMKVEWRSNLNEGAEVWPSQEYVREEKKSKDVGRIYATMPYISESGRIVKQASIHSQKIGAALRHIDDFHGDANYGPITINPYGGVKSTGAVLRAPRGSSALSLYAIMDKPQKLVDEATKPADEMSGDLHFFMANLVRGGVFGFKKEKADKTKKDAGETATATAAAEGEE